MRALCGAEIKGNVIWPSEKMRQVHEGCCDKCKMARVHAAAKEKGDVAEDNKSAGPSA